MIRNDSIEIAIVVNTASKSRRAINVTMGSQKSDIRTQTVFNREITHRNVAAPF